MAAGDRFLSFFIIAVAGTVFYATNISQKQSGGNLEIPATVDDRNEEGGPDKHHRWTIAESQEHNRQLLAKLNNQGNGKGAAGIYAGGLLQGSWQARGPYNQPGCWELSEVDATNNTVWSITCAHYGESQFIFKGSLVGDDFTLISGKFPNEFQDIFVIPHNAGKRLVVGIRNGGIAWTDDDGTNWNFSTGLSGVIMNTVVNRQDGNRIYATDGRQVYVSTNDATSFSLLQDFGTQVNARLYTPRYSLQPDSAALYLSREGNFYKLNAVGTSFALQGSFSWTGTDKNYSIGGDSRRLYVTSDKKYWTSIDEGVNWQTRTPTYFDQTYKNTGTFSAGHIIGVNPENPEIVLGGYMDPLFSWDNLQNVTERKVWGQHQVASAPTPDDRHRNYLHADNQSVQFFYDSSGKLFSLHNSDGGVYISYNEWKDQTLPTDGVYGDSIYFNLTLFGTQSTEIYPSGMITGARNPDHILLGTQDQGTQTVNNPGAAILSFRQSPYGDGPHLISADGEIGWSFDYTAKKVFPPFALYDGSGNFLGSQNRSSATWQDLNLGGWYFHNAYVDLGAPSTRIWILSKQLAKVEYNGSFISAVKDFSGSNYVGAIAQSSLTHDKLWVIENGKVYRSTDRGLNWDTGIVTGITSGSSGWDRCGGWVSPTDDSKVLFSCPSTGSIVSVYSDDGGNSWSDVSGNFPNGDIGGMKGSPDGNFIFASTNLGPYVFAVSTKTWYDLAANDAPWFDGRQMEYIASTNTMRFSTWGLGIWDFHIDDGTPFLNLAAPGNNAELTTDSTLHITWTTNLTGNVSLKLYSEANEVTNLGSLSATTGQLDWTIPTSTGFGIAYMILISEDGGSLADSSGRFTITPSYLELASSHLTLQSFDSEYAGREAAFVLDDDPSTFWHTEWATNPPDFPHELVFLADTSVKLAALTYLPRKDGSSNGSIASYEVYLSQDGLSWGTAVASGTWANDSKLKTAYFNNPTQATWVKFVALSEVNGKIFASAAEIDLLYLEEILPKSSSSVALSSSARSSSVALSSSSEGSVFLSQNIEFPSGALFVEVFNITGQLLRAIEVSDPSMLEQAWKGLPRGLILLRIRQENRVQKMWKAIRM